MLYVSQLENIKLLTDRYRTLLIAEGSLSVREIEHVIQKDFLNSKVRDIDYLLNELQLTVHDKTVYNKGEKL